MSLVPYIQYNERVVGENSPLGYQDVENRPLKYVMLQSGLDDTQDFLGFASGSAGDGVPEGSVLGRVGDIYADRANTSGVIWVKSSGNNTNLGWRSVVWVSSGGTAGTIPKFGTAGSLVDSIVTESGGIITVTGSERIFNASSGSFLIGTTDGASALGATEIFRIEGTGTGIGITRYANESTVRMRRAEGSSGAETALASGNVLGRFRWAGYNGTTYIDAATISAQASQAYSGVANGTRLLIQITLNGATAPITLASFDGVGTGAFLPGLNNTYSVGVAGTVWSGVFAPVVDSGSATDLLLKRNAITQLTLGSLDATFAGSLNITTFYTVGTNVATAGAGRYQNNTALNWRNQANTANIPALAVDTSNNTVIDSGTGGGVILRNIGFPFVTFLGTAATFAANIAIVLDNTGGFVQLGGSTTSTVGRIRARYNDLIIGGRNATGTGNYSILQYGGAAYTNVTLLTGENGVLVSQSVGGTTGWLFNDTLLRPQTTNTQDIGAVGMVIRTLYLGTSLVVPEVLSPVIDSGSATDLILQRNNVTQLTLGSLTATFAGVVNVGTTAAFVSGIGLDVNATGASVLRLTRDTNTVNAGIGWDVRAKDSGGTVVQYGTANFAIVTNTAGAYGGRFSVFPADSGAAGAIALRFSVFGTGSVRVGSSTTDPALGAGWLLAEGGVSAPSMVAPLHGTVTAVDVVIQRNSVAQLTLSSLLATFAGDIVANGTIAHIAQSNSTNITVTVGSGTQAGDAYFRVRAPAGNYSMIGLRTGNVERWTLSRGNAAETGADAGSQFILGAYTDAGVFIDNPITIVRAAGGTISFPTARSIASGPIGITGTLTTSGNILPLATDTVKIGTAGKGYVSLAIEHNSSRADGILMIQTLAGQASPRLFFNNTTDWPGAANVMYQSASNTLSFTTGGTPGSASGTNRWSYNASGIFPAVTNAMTFGNASFVWSNVFATQITSTILDSGAASDLVLKRNNVTQLTLGSLLATFAGDIDVASGKVYKVNATQVVGPRVTGYAAMTGSANKATVYDTATVTLAQLAGRIMQLQADLTTHGLIGA